MCVLLDANYTQKHATHLSNTPYVKDIGGLSRSFHFNLFFQTYLKEIMREIGTYNSKGAHKSTWELKSEYRHYQSAEEEEEMQTA